MKLVAFDDRAQANETAYYYQLLLNSTDFLLGPCTLGSDRGMLSCAVSDLLVPDGTSLTTVANDVANAQGRLIVFANAQAEDIYQQGYPLIFGVGASPTHSLVRSLTHSPIHSPGTTAYRYTDPAVFYLRLRGARTAGVLHSDADFTASVAQGALNTLAAAGSPVGSSAILKFEEVIGFCLSKKYAYA